MFFSSFFLWRNKMLSIRWLRKWGKMKEKHRICVFYVPVFLFSLGVLPLTLVFNPFFIWTLWYYKMIIFILSLVGGKMEGEKRVENWVLDFLIGSVACFGSLFAFLVSRTDYFWLGCRNLGQGWLEDHLKECVWSASFWISKLWLSNVKMHRRYKHCMESSNLSLANSICKVVCMVLLGVGR